MRAVRPILVIRYAKCAAPSWEERWQQPFCGGKWFSHGKMRFTAEEREKSSFLKPFFDDFSHTASIKLLAGKLQNGQGDGDHRKGKRKNARKKWANEQREMRGCLPSTSTSR